MRSLWLLLLVAAVSGTGLAQDHSPSYADLTLVRNRRWAKDSFLEIRAGGLGGFAAGEDKARQAENIFGADGHAYYRSVGAFGRQGRLDAYIGRDGAYAGLIEGDPRVSKGYSRIELFGRQWGNFIREGFYRSGDFIPVGLYEAKDWNARLSFATQFTDSLRGEAGAFYGQRDFARSSRTAAAYTIPDDYAVYGAHAIVEDNKVEVDPRTLLPTKGYVLTGWIEREWNDSNKPFGVAGSLSTLPSAIVRGGAHIEYYIPYTNTTTFVLQGDFAMTPDDDRVWQYDPSKPVGKMYVDGRIDYRMLLGDHLTLKPGVRGQWVRIADEFRATTDSEFFFGAQLELRWDFSENLGFAVEYSYLSNESRRPVSLSRDTIGEHRLFFGFEFHP